MAAVVFAVSAVATLTDQHPLSGPDGELEERLLLVAAALVASSAAFLLLRWRMTNHNTSLYAATSLFGVTLTIVTSEPAAFGLHGGLAGHAFPVVAVTTVAVAWHVTAVPEIDIDPRAWRVLVAFAGALAAGTAGLAVLDIGLPEEGEPAYVALVGSAAVGWSTIAWSWIRDGRRRRDGGLAWGSVLFMAVAGWQVSVVGAVSAGRPIGVAGTLLVAAGALAALRGGIESLREAMEVQDRELLATRERVNEEQSQAERARAAAEERAHEARSALHSVGAAIQTLERYHELLDAATKRKLSAGVAFELERLQRLIDLDERTEPTCAFSLHDALDAVIVGAVGGGLDLTVDVPDDLVVIGQPQATAEIVQNLLVNAQRHACGRDVSLRAHEDGDRVVVLVADGGPGVPLGEREAVFRRSHCSEATGGSGFGLYVSRRLARAQGGDLWVADRPGGGAVFGFDLAASVGRGAAGLALDDQLHHVGEARRG